ncbi:MAG: protein arginine kinase [Planctomycetota bacterium]|nr:protein arginine kinase [Planctomycetota bacterium]
MRSLGSLLPLPTQKMPFSPIDVHRLASRVGSWLTSEGPESDVVVSCRVRLARNVEGFSFVSRLGEAAAKELCEVLRQHLLSIELDGETLWVEMKDAPVVLRLMLRERHLISRDMAPVEDSAKALPGRAVAFGENETLSVMVNEEDHLRVQAIEAGFDLDRAWRSAQAVDRLLENRVNFAVSERLGYLTGCPTNVGTGLRASVMLHLPGLSLVRSELEKVFAAAQRTGLAVRGLYGEGSKAAGDFYQVSNQVTLGRTEDDLIDDLRSLVPVIINFERTVRSALLEDQGAALRDRVSRSIGLLRTARAMPTETALAHLSNVRLGKQLAIENGPSLTLLNELGIQVQRGHLQALAPGGSDSEASLDVSERDRFRAGFLRQRLANEGS